MKKIVMSMVMFCTLVTFGYSAQGQWSVAPFIGQSSIDASYVDDGMALGLSLLYGITDQFSVELSYKQSQFDFEYSSASADLDVSSFGIYGVGQLPIGEKCYLKGKAGVSMNEGDATVSYSYNYNSYYFGSRHVSGQYSFEVDDTEFSAGVAFGCNVNEKLSVEVEANYMGEDFTTYGVKANWVFA